MSKRRAYEKAPAEAAAEAASDLNTFAIVVSVLENGHVHADSRGAAKRIIKIAIAEQQRCLRRYDAKLAAIPTPGGTDG